MTTADESAPSAYEDFMKGIVSASAPIYEASMSKSEWQLVCVCGHLARFHSTAIGGKYPEERREAGELWDKVHRLTGCCGEVIPRGHSTTEDRPDRANRVLYVERKNTCPCVKFRPVAEVWDPRLRFNQRRPVVKGSKPSIRDYDPARHAFATGIRATITSIEKLSKVKQAEEAPNYRKKLISQLFDERFRWISGFRICAFPHCNRTEDVWPVYVAGDQSELRCPEHRDR